MNAVYQFLKTIQGAGLTPPGAIIPDGKLHRFASNGKRGDDSGWYVFHEDGIPAGAFGDWRSALSRTWRADIGRNLTPAELAAHQARVDAANRAREEEETRRKAKAAGKAAAIFEAATQARGDHPYLVRKQVAPVASLGEIDDADVAAILDYAPKYRGKPLVGRLLVVPVENAGELRTLELIDEAGRKSALYGGPKKGGYWEAQELPDGDGQELTILVGEGIATTLSAREATGHLVVAALSSSNLLAVAKAMRERYPAAKRGILGDLGKGQQDAKEAARSTGSALILPAFGEDRPEGATDLNDLHAHRGLGAVTECIAAQLAAHEARQRTAGEKAPGGGEARSGNGDAEDLEATVRRLAGLSPIEYDRERKAKAKQLGVRVATLDAKVEKLPRKLAGNDNDSQKAKGVKTSTEPGLTDLGNAHRFAREHQTDTRYCWPWAKWLVWNGRFWSHDDSGAVYRLAEKTVRAMYTAAGKLSMPRREALGEWARKSEAHDRRVKIAGVAARRSRVSRSDPRSWIGIHGC